MELDDPRADVAAPMARRLYEPARHIVLDTGPLAAGDEQIDTEALFTQFTVDRERLRAAVRASLRQRRQATLADVIGEHPITQGLAEVVTYLSIADGDPRAAFDPAGRQTLTWTEPDGERRRAEVPLVLFTDPEAGS